MLQLKKKDIKYLLDCRSLPRFIVIFSGKKKKTSFSFFFSFSLPPVPIYISTSSLFLISLSPLPSDTSVSLALGNTPEKIAEFSIEDMNAMTTENYEKMNKLENPNWINFFKTLKTEAKVTVLEGMWNLTTVEEKEAIIKDLQYFLVKPTPEEEAIAAALDAVELNDDGSPAPPDAVTNGPVIEELVEDKETSDKK